MIFGKKPDELPIPSAVSTDKQSFEILRIWISSGKQVVTLKDRVWKDPAAWGLMLADLAKHVARMYQQTEEMDYHQCLIRVLEGFHAEMDRPTDQPEGKISS
jgi:hypothetical protein